jgi:hypothetical protein
MGNACFRKWKTAATLQPASGSLKKQAMKTIGIFLLWCLLLAVCWPLAILALLLAPVVWLISIPFRLLGICMEATFSFIKTLLFLPAGYSVVPEEDRAAKQFYGWEASETRDHDFRKYR